jgi:hypothetical protein
MDTCVECEREVGRRNLARVEVMQTLPSGGYEYVPMPMCRACRVRLHGHDCLECGTRHLDLEDAALCCEGPQAGEAPDCIECGRRMARGSWGYDPVEGPTVDWAECEACNIGWGKWTGWHDLDAEEGDDD